jgi:hypothetical protein
MAVRHRPDRKHYSFIVCVCCGCYQAAHVSSHNRCVAMVLHITIWCLHILVYRYRLFLWPSERVKLPELLLKFTHVVTAPMTSLQRKKLTQTQTVAYSCKVNKSSEFFFLHQTYFVFTHTTYWDMWKTRYTNHWYHSLFVIFESEFRRSWPMSMSHICGMHMQKLNITLMFTE